MWQPQINDAPLQTAVFVSGGDGGGGDGAGCSGDASFYASVSSNAFFPHIASGLICMLCVKIGA